MKYEELSRPIKAPLLAAMVAGASLLVGPLFSAVVDLPTVEHAYAKGGKSGKGGGGGHGGGHGGGNSASASVGKGSGHDKARGLGHEKARGLGHSKEPGANTAVEHEGISASALGRLNAAHAAQRARDRAAEHSTVGLIAAYADALGTGEELSPEDLAAAAELLAAAEFLAAAANKPIDSTVVNAVNDLLGIALEPAEVDTISGAAAALQAPAAVEAEGGEPVQ